MSWTVGFVSRAAEVEVYAMPPDMPREIDLALARLKEMK
jgi:hypothetical protein